MMTPTRDDNPFLAKHRQITEAILQDIASGSLKANDRLPSEKELCRIWQVSRGTVRLAMEYLTLTDRIIRVPGKGSFVTPRKIKIDQPVSQLLSFTAKMKAKGFKIKTRLLEQVVIEPDKKTAAKLKLRAGEKAIYIQRLRIVEDEPMALQSAIIPIKYAANILEENLEEQSLNKLMREDCGISLSRSEIWVEAPVLSRREIKLLGDPPIPVFISVVGLTYDTHENPVRLSRGVFRGDRTSLKITTVDNFELDQMTW